MREPIRPIHRAHRVRLAARGPDAAFSRHNV